MAWLKGLLLVISVAAMLGCAKSDRDEDNSGKKVALTPSEDCMISGGIGCNSDYFLQQRGFRPYQRYDGRYMNHSFNYANGFCGCPSSYRPVYHNAYGLGCVWERYIQNNSWGHQASLQFSWSWSPEQSRWLNVNQASYQPIYSGSGCYGDVLPLCDVGQPSSCGSRGQCRSMGGGGRLGICQFDANLGGSWGVM